MVTCENKNREPQMSHYHNYYHGNSNVKVHRPQPTVWYRLSSSTGLSKFPEGQQSATGCTHHSAFRPVSTKSLASSDRTRPCPLVWRNIPEAEDNTQLTWCCSDGNSYRCSVAVSGVDSSWNLHLRNRGSTHLKRISQVTGEDHKIVLREHENGGEVDVGEYEIDGSSRDTNSPKCDSRSEEGSTCLSPVPHEGMRRVAPEFRLKTVISSSNETTCGPTRESPTAEGNAVSTNSFVQKNKQIHVKPIYISEVPRSQLPLHHQKTEYSRPASFSAGEGILVNKSIPLVMSSNGNERECWSTSPPPHNVREHMSGEHVTLPRFSEDDIVSKKGDSVVATGGYSVTEQGSRTSIPSSTIANEEIARNSPIDASNFNEKVYYRNGDEEKQNTLYCTPKEYIPRTTVLLAIDDIKDSLHGYATPSATDDNSANSNRTLYPHEERRGIKAYGMKPTVIQRDTLRDVSTATVFNETESSDLKENAHSKRTTRRQDGEAAFVVKYPDIGDKHFLCEYSTSFVLRSAARNHTQIHSKQSFEETVSSKQNCAPNEYSAHIDEEQCTEDRGELPHKSSHLEYHTKSDEEQLFMDGSVLQHARSPAKNTKIVSADVFEYRNDCPRKCSPTVNPIQIGDHQSVEDPGDFFQNTPLMGTYIQNEDCNGCVRPNIPSETVREIGDREFMQNGVVKTGQSSPLRNGTQTDVQQFNQSPGTSPRSRCPLNGLRQTNPQQHLCFQRSTVLAQSGNWRPGGGEAAVQQMDGASEAKISAEAQEPCLFSAEDTALRSRVLVLLWVLLGERRLREVGYPAEPVHRILWRAVDVCCSVAGVKSAAAVPLNADHDCGLDMLCFRDHTHRFLEVCAPTREHWKQFGWASLTVDAVVRKIYDEELVPLLRLQVLPPGIQEAVTHLSKLDCTPMHRHSSSLLPPEGDSAAEKLQTAVVMPAKKKRGRPAKISSHKVEEGGRIERVMLWRFLLNLLEDPRNVHCIHWVHRDEGIFRILNTDWLARLWGRRHGNPRMTYEKMARAMRTYYRSKVLQPVPRLRNLPRKLVYKFNPAVIHKVAAMKLSRSTFSGRGLNYNTNNN